MLCLCVHASSAESLACGENMSKSSKYWIGNFLESHTVRNFFSMLHTNLSCIWALRMQCATLHLIAGFHRDS